MLKKFTKKQRRLLALALASVMVISALAIGIGSTLAAKNPVVVTFSQPNEYPTLEINESFSVPGTGIFRVASGDSAIATAENIDSYLVVTGKSAGITGISSSSRTGYLRSYLFQITDNRNIVKYTIANGAEVFFSEIGKTIDSPVTVETGLNTPAANAAAFDDISWSVPDAQQDIAEVDNDGIITALAKGAAIIQGVFTDKWGVRQTLSILVGVQISLGDEDLDSLLEALKKGKEILDDAVENEAKYIDSGIDELEKAVEAGEIALNDPNGDRKQAADDIWDAIRDLQRRLRRNKLEDAIARGEDVLADADADPGKYNNQDDLLQALEDAIEEGKDVLANPDATDDQCDAAADKILDIIQELAKGGGGDIIIGPDGKKYRSLSRPPHLFEELDDEGKSHYPPIYIYNEDDNPGNGNNRDAHGPKGGYFYVEDPKGSNIYKPVDGDGNLSDEDAIWGGPDKEFGTDDDLPAVKNDETGKWYAYFGQNVYWEIDSNSSSANYGQLIGTPFGAGEDGTPGDGNELRPIFPPPYQQEDGTWALKPYGDGKFYAGPFGAPTGPYGVYFIGDRAWNDNGNGELSTSGNGTGGHLGVFPENQESADRRWYMDPNGNMIDARRDYNITGVTITPSTADLYQGQYFQFTATVQGTQPVPQMVHWEIVSDHRPGTVITNRGQLVIAVDETAATLTIRATSDYDTRRSGTATVTISPSMPVLTEATVDKIATGRSSFLIKDNGTIWGAGLNNRGQLGLGDTRNRTAYVPALVTPATLTFKAVSAFAYGTESHTLAITPDGTLYTWGYNNRGQLGNGGTANRNVPTLTSLGTSVKFKAVAAGRNFSAAIAEDDQLYTWGWNNEGQLGIGATSPTIRNTPQTMNNTALRFQAVSAGDRCVYAITYEGVDAAGNNLPGKLYAWGNNGSGRLGTGNTTRRTAPTPIAVGGSFDPIVKMVAGRSLGHVLVLTADGTLYSCGANGYGQLGSGSTKSRSTLSAPVAAVKFKTIGTGHYHSMALTAEGNLYTWGRNNYGQVGDNTTRNKTSPTWISRDGRKYVAMAAGEYTSMAVCAEGRLYLWGYNNYGQFGNGTTVRKNYPHFVPLA